MNTVGDDLGNASKASPRQPMLNIKTDPCSELGKRQIRMWSYVPKEVRSVSRSVHSTLFIITPSKDRNMTSDIPSK